MTLRQARDAAEAWSEKGRRILVIQAKNGEVRTGYYWESDSDIVPPEQIVAVYQDGKEAPID